MITVTSVFLYFYMYNINSIFHNIYYIAAYSRESNPALTDMRRINHQESNKVKLIHFGTQKVYSACFCKRTCNKVLGSKPQNIALLNTKTKKKKKCYYDHVFPNILQCNCNCGTNVFVYVASLVSTDDRLYV